MISFPIICKVLWHQFFPLLVTEVQTPFRKWALNFYSQVERNLPGEKTALSISHVTRPKVWFTSIALQAFRNKILTETPFVS